MDDRESFVLAVFRKSGRGRPMSESCDGRLRLITGYGIEGDENANASSPRQVLLTRAEDNAAFHIPLGQLRENIVVGNLPSASFVPGAALRIGDQVQLRLTFHCEPCKRIGHLVRSLKELQGRRGILAVVLHGGVVTVGAPVHSEPDAYPALPPEPYARFLEYLQQVPTGRVVNYRQLLIGMGVADSYVRAIPGYIQKARDVFPVHRIVDSQGFLIPNHVPGQLSRLRSEGVEVRQEADLFDLHVADSVDLAVYGWSGGICLV
jgi:alkylated DNA nucleotide flippase Atl1